MSATLTIALSDVGTPQQPVIPAGEIAGIDLTKAPVPVPMTNGDTQETDCGVLTLPSSANMERDAYFELVRSMNPNVLPNMSTHPTDVFRAQTLTNAWEQEFNSNPDSAHGKVLSGN